MAGGACQYHSDLGLVFMAVTLESLRQMVLVETGALAHNPGIKARVLAGATHRNAEDTVPDLGFSQQVAETDGLTQDFSVMV